MLEVDHYNHPVQIPRTLVVPLLGSHISAGAFRCLGSGFPGLMGMACSGMADLAGWEPLGPTWDSSSNLWLRTGQACQQGASQSHFQGHLNSCSAQGDCAAPEVRPLVP